MRAYKESDPLPVMWSDMIECSYCGRDYDGTRFRWLCPFCKCKDTCCEGADTAGVYDADNHTEES